MRNGEADMRRSIRLMTLAAAVAVAAPLGLANSTGSAGADGPVGAVRGGTFVPLNQVLRRCDFSATEFNGPTGYARATSVIRTSGSGVSADVEMNTAIPNMRYDVRLIQSPRSSAATCHGGDPGVAAGVLQINGAGYGAVTLNDAVEPGATGVWVFITRPDAFSQNPAEFYTSDWIEDV
ncbi:hypothetical protein BST21_12570 [Mycolicibacterium celeriflavum]|uniref:Uncharacterized protein n=2 Tax=Mycolicibacterium celeriflavum TaxID=1249101 RepID=A0A1X0BV11_MYCCF|nr:hypothetical protein BST21_12570 [Mycolicibacterium celeriflavum]BBY42414.1 hypothetical protein MCEL_07090 [Mycolicibacterium celeriflavum]